MASGEGQAAIDRRGFELVYLLGGVASYPPGARMKKRRTVDHELVWIQRGEVVYHVNGKDMVAGPGTMILSRPGFEEGYTWDREVPTRHAYFHCGLIGLPAAWGPEESWPILRAMPAADVIRPLFEFILGNISGGVEDKPGATLALAVETMLSAFIIGPLVGASEARGEYPEPVHRAMEFVGRRLQDDPAASISLQDLADAALVSNKHLCRVFAQALGVSPMDAVMACRLHHAAQLLARTDLKLEAVARHCGFATPFHFSRRFKEFYGRPPSVFREAALRGAETVDRQLRLGAGLMVEYGSGS